MMVVGWNTVVDDSGRKGTEVDGGRQCRTRVDDGSQWKIGVYDKLQNEHSTYCVWVME